ncbi:uncharacterized protein NEMAJ01_2079 [Nematocida major]|uniref:uncharacterized protein n=1 Tax=Nematocida major TaxID=1912982 RepID=UPI0020080AED|nr:uncharacterized protein NEMAJ01_2079 [Nematocida major]KAH9387183.1 hypothetical protein NEMAJ01_2079 [Nematocida major]
MHIKEEVKQTLIHNDSILLVCKNTVLVHALETGKHINTLENKHSKYHPYNNRIYTIENRSICEYSPEENKEAKICDLENVFAKCENIAPEIVILGKYASDLSRLRSHALEHPKAGVTYAHISSTHVHFYAVKESSLHILHAHRYSGESGENEGKSTFCPIPFALYKWHKDTLYTLHGSTLHAHDVLAGESKKVAEFPGAEITALEVTSAFVAAGTKCSQIMILNLASSFLQKVAYYSSPLFSLDALTESIIASKGEDGKIITVDCNSLLKTYIYTDQTKVRDRFTPHEEGTQSTVSPNGYIVLDRRASIRVINIPTRTKYTLYKTHGAKCIPVEAVRSDEESRFVPTFSEANKKRDIWLDAKEEKEEGSTFAYCMDNVLVFVRNEKVLRIVEEPSRIQQVLYSNGHLLVSVVDSEEMEVIREYSVEQKPRMRHKMYKILPNGVERVYSGLVEAEGDITGVHVGDTTVLTLQAAEEVRTQEHIYPMGEIVY